MCTMEKIAFFQDRRDEVPNQLLAKELAESKNKEGILEVVENLKNKNKNIRSDCLKVLYEIGYLDPSLIAGHVEAFMKLLKSKDNRMVWGAMIALATITDLKPKEIWIQIDDVIRITETGTVITQVWGMRTLAKVAAADQAYEKRIFPFLLKQLQICIPRDVPTRAESVLCAVNKGNKKKMLDALEKRRGEMTAAQLTRFKKVLKQLDAI